MGLGLKFVGSIIFVVVVLFFFSFHCACVLLQVVGMVTRKDIARYRMWSHRGQIGLEEVHILEANSIHDSF